MICCSFSLHSSVQSMPVPKCCEEKTAKEAALPAQDNTARLETTEYCE